MGHKTDYVGPVDDELREAIKVRKCPGRNDKVVVVDSDYPISKVQQIVSSYNTSFGVVLK